MNAIAECPTCHEEGVSAGIIPQQGHYPGDLVEGVSAEINDSFLAYFTCSKGHKSIGFFNKHRFEILLESGLLAYLSGFTGEAVLSFAASLERLYELFIRVVSHKRGISFEHVDTTWKHLARQSERQLGGFLLLYLIEIEKPYSLNTQVAEFRNKVIHQGYIPTREEVYRWASLVVDIIFDIVIELRNKCSNSLTAIVFANAKRANGNLALAREKDPSLRGLHVVNITIPSIIGLNFPDDVPLQRKTLAELLEERRQLNAMFGY